MNTRPRGCAEPSSVRWPRSIAGGPGGLARASMVVGVLWASAMPGWGTASGGDQGLPAIKVGFLIPPEESEAASLRAGAEEAARRRFDGRPVELVVRGRVGQWGDDGVEAGRLALDDAVYGLITPPDGAATHLTLQVAGRTALPAVSLCADSVVRQTGIPWMVQVVPDTQAEAAALFQRFRPKDEGAPCRWLAVVPPGRPGREIGEDLGRAAARFNSASLSLHGPALGADRWTGALAAVAEERPDLVLVWWDAESAGELIRRLRGQGYAGALAGPGRLRSLRFIECAGAAARDFVVPGIRVDAEAAAEAERIGETFRERHGRDPDASACLAYDAVLVLAELAIRPGAGSSRRFAGLPPLRGATGWVRFDSEGRRDVELDLLVWRGDGWRP